MALYNKGLMLAARDPAAAVAPWDEVVARFGNVTEPELREQVAKALYSSGVVLKPSDRPGAVEAYDEVISRSGSQPSPSCASR